MDFSPLSGLLIVAVLILLNGFFVATEYALVSSRPTRIDQLAAQGNRAARLVQKAKVNPTLFISGTQLGVTVASLVLGWLGEDAFARVLLPPLGWVGGLLSPYLGSLAFLAAAITAQGIATLLALVCITFFQVVLGEQVPKILALQKAEPYILFAVLPMQVLLRIFGPFISLLYLFTNAVLRLLGREFRADESGVHSPEELQLLVSRTARAGLMTVPERELVQRAFNFGDLTAGEAMVPRTEVVGLSQDASLDAAIQLALRYRHSRFPVYDGTIDNVVGVLSTKDLLAAAARQPARGATPPGRVKRLMRPPVIVPEGAPVSEVLARMKAARQPVAVILDEFGGTAGIVTLKDLVARLLGEVGDEYTPASQDVRVLADSSVLVDGLALVEDVNQQLGAHFDTSEVDTVGGLLFARLGQRPHMGDEADLGSGYSGRVERLDGLRIALVRLVPAKVLTQDVAV